MNLRLLVFLCLAVAASGAPVATVTTPTPGNSVSTLTTISVTFNEAVAGVDAVDLLINSEAAASVSGSGAGPYTFTFTQPPPGIVAVSWEFDHGIAGLGTGAFDPAEGWSYTLADILPPAIAKVKTSVPGQEQDAVVPVPGTTVGALTQVEVTFSEAVTGVNAADLLIGGVAAISVTGSEAGPYVFTCAQPPAGAVAIQWIGGHGIIDTAGNAFAGGSWNVTRSAAGAGSLVINEILAANASIAPADENGDFSDWLEIRNTGATAVNLLGWSLSTDPAEPNQWIFPSRTLNAGAHLLVFASGKDRKPAAGNLHTNFTLNAEGSSIYLFRPDGPRGAAEHAFVDYPPQRYNYSYGIQAAGLRYFAAPTPGSTNGSSSLTAIAPAPIANVRRGFFNEPFKVILSCTDPAATIRFTLDGSVPLATSPAYSTPLNVANTTLLRAAAFSATAVPSETVTHSYIFLDSVFDQTSPPYDNPANPSDNSNPQPPSVGGVPLSVYLGTRSIGNVPFPGSITNLSSNQVPADYGMDAKIWADPAKYDDSGAINNTTGKTNLERMKQSLRELPALSVVFKTADILSPTGSYCATTSGSKPDLTKPCSLELLFADGRTGFVVPAGIDIHGNASRNPENCPKRGFTIRFKGAYGAGALEYPLFPDSPATKFNKLVLRGDFNSSWGHHDNNTQRPKGTRIRDAFCKHTFRDMGRPAGRNRHLNLFLNGIYWGTYDLAEEEDDGFGEAYFGGQRDDYDVIEQGILKEGTNTVYNAMLAIASPITDPKFEQMKGFLDVPFFIDYMLLHFFVGHQDWGDNINKNWYTIRNRAANGTFKYLPWDMENLMWSESVNRVGVGSPPSGLHTKLITNTQYRLDFADRVHAHMVSPDGALLPAANIARLNKWTGIMNAGAMALESARWGDYRRDVHGFSSNANTVYTWNGRWFEGGIPRTGTANWRNEIIRLTNTYFPQRTNNVLAQLRTFQIGGQPMPLYPSVNAPEIRNNATNLPIASQQVPAGFVVKFANVNVPPSGTTNAGTFYYTTNGADPRVYYSGAIDASATAVAPNAALTLNATTTIKARAFIGSTWSALNEQTFTVGPTQPFIRISEIHYNPPAGQGGSAAEFIELHNTGATRVDLSGWSFDGISLTVPYGTGISPDGRLVFASNNAPATFAAQFPGVNVSAYFGGSLDNGGERIALLDAAGSVVASVNYDDSVPWPAAADGDGPSLEIIDPDGDASSPFNWKASSAAKGTPGAPNSVPAASDIRISEFFVKNRGVYTIAGANPGFVELANSGAATADVSNWQVATPEGGVFVLPGGTSIPANQYLLIHFTPAALPGLRVPVALGEPHGRIELRNAGGARVDGVQYGPQAADFSFARSGNEWALASPTPGAANAIAATASQASLRLNEWLANPSPGYDDWLEIANGAAQPVVLTGIYAGASAEFCRITAPTAIGAGGYAQFLCKRGGSDGNVLDLNLPASGATLRLQDNAGAAIDSLTFTAQPENATQGRLPNLTGSVVALPFPSPALPNHAAIAGGPVINEILVTSAEGDNAPWAARPGWIELRNPAAAPFSLAGWALRNPARLDASWTFPAGATLPALGHLAIWADPAQPPSTSNALHLNCVFPNASAALGSNGLELVNPSGQIVDRVTWGKQIADRSIGRLNDNSWALLASPTRGSSNQGAAALGPTSAVRINEWYAVGSDPDFDYVELYNTSALPVALGGLFLTDDPSERGQRNFQFPPLTFINGTGFLTMSAAGNADANFTGFGLDGGGEYLRLGLSDSSLLEAIGFGLQSSGTSEGRQPEGSEVIASFPATPGAPNSAGSGPTITRHPKGATVPGGGSIALEIVATGATSYQWQRNGLNIPGAADSILALGPVVIEHDGVYRCVATGPGGSTTSLPARVTVLFTYELWADRYGLSGSNRPGLADADRDGLNNYEEFVANTDPLITATAAERANAHPVAGLEWSGETPAFLTLDVRLNRRAAFADWSAETSANLLDGWQTASPSSVELLETEANGDQRLRLKFPLPADSTQRHLRLTLTP